MSALLDGGPQAIVPAYFHPAANPDAWEWLAQHASQVRLVVLNVADGPGDRPDPVFLDAVAPLQKAGVTVSGYVYTSYGRRPSEEALADLERYLDWYGVAGVVFDEVSSGVGQVGHYAALAARARDLGAPFVVFNHGVHPAKEYAKHADLLGTFESTWRDYVAADLPRWVHSLPAEHFYHLVHSVPRARLGDAYALVAQRHVGAAFITECGGGNPYDRLPSCLLDAVPP
jgi:Spherulation-specific family 4